MKDKHQMINEIVRLAADAMEAKVEYLELVAIQFEEHGCMDKATYYRNDIDTIKQAIDVMRLRNGCWA